MSSVPSEVRVGFVSGAEMTDEPRRPWDMVPTGMGEREGGPSWS